MSAVKLYIRFYGVLRQMNVSLRSMTLALVDVPRRRRLQIRRAYSLLELGPLGPQDHQHHSTPHAWGLHSLSMWIYNAVPTTHCSVHIISQLCPRVAGHTTLGGQPFHSATRLTALTGETNQFSSLQHVSH